MTAADDDDSATDPMTMSASVADDDDDDDGSSSGSSGGDTGTTDDGSTGHDTGHQDTSGAHDTSTGTGDLVHVVAAMAALGADADAADKPALISHLLLYHADDDRGSDAAWQKALVSGLHTNATSASREALRYVAQDPRTVPSLATMINETIGAD